MLVEHLPASSATVEAQLDDPEYAAWAATQKPAPPTAPRLSEWSPDVARLTDIHDRLSELIAAVIASGGGKPPRPAALPRPRTEVDRLRAKARRSRHDSLVAEVQAAQERWRATRP